MKIHIDWTSGITLEESYELNSPTDGLVAKNQLKAETIIVCSNDGLE